MSIILWGSSKAPSLPADNHSGVDNIISNAIMAKEFIMNNTTINQGTEEEVEKMIQTTIRREFSTLETQIRQETDPTKKAKLKTFERYCIDEELAPSAVIDFEDYLNWGKSELIEYEEMMLVHEFHEEMQFFVDHK